MKKIIFIDVFSVGIISIILGLICYFLNIENIIHIIFFSYGIISILKYSFLDNRIYIISYQINNNKIKIDYYTTKFKKKSKEVDLTHTKIIKIKKYYAGTYKGLLDFGKDHGSYVQNYGKKETWIFNEDLKTILENK